jgi:nucleotide-binding universal stress UspA family protein
VVEPATRGGMGLREETSTAAFDARAEFKRLAAERLVASIPPSIREQATVRELVTIGSPAAEILHTTEQEDCDLIVLGVSKRTTTDLLLFGSTAQEVLREARCPVLTVASVTVS